jgi:hypothetical protein
MKSSSSVTITTIVSACVRRGTFAGALVGQTQAKLAEKEQAQVDF